VAQATESSLPPFGKEGDLPPGIYRSTLGETLRRFGKESRQRFAAARQLERIYRVAVGTGQLARFVVFGSFVTAKREPADVDLFLLMEDTFDIGQLTTEADFFSTMRQRKHILEQVCFGCAVLQRSEARSSHGSPAFLKGRYENM
jgi:predicted nucleotidyltransferase